MSDLVGNPEDRFSQNEAHLRPNMHFLSTLQHAYQSFLSYFLVYLHISGRKVLFTISKLFLR